MFNLFKYILFIIIIYMVLRYIQKVLKKLSTINQHVKGRSEKSGKNKKYNNIEDADFEDIE